MFFWQRGIYNFGLKASPVITIERDCTALCKQILKDNTKFYLLATWNLPFFSLKYYSLETLNASQLRDVSAPTAPWMHFRVSKGPTQSSAGMSSPLLEIFQVPSAPCSIYVNSAQRRCVALQFSKLFPLHWRLKSSVLSTMAALLGAARPKGSTDGNGALSFIFHVFHILCCLGV